jgi:hypothetical protein
LVAELYNAIYQLVLSRPDVAELTIEDPAEAFEDLRDRNDLKMLLDNRQFMREGLGDTAASHGGGKVGGKTGRATKRKGPAKGKLGPPAEKGWVEQWRVELKMAKVKPFEIVGGGTPKSPEQRQFQRLIEMLIQMHLDPSDLQGKRAYRLQVKERLYRFNFVGLQFLYRFYSLTGMFLCCRKSWRNWKSKSGSRNSRRHTRLSKQTTQGYWPRFCELSMTNAAYIEWTGATLMSN